MNEEILALLTLSQIEGIGAKNLRRLRQQWGSLTPLTVLSPHSKPPQPLPYSLIQALPRLTTYRKQAENILQECARLGIQLVPFWSLEYPPLLQEIPHPPAILYYKGHLLPSGSPTVAVVGTRKPSSYGLQVTEHFVEALVEAGITIVSGLAYGIDAQAHAITLRKGGRTIAVLAHGLDRIYPPAHRQLAAQILATGAWVSEYPPGTPLHPLQFPFRNRIIAGLAHLTLVVESGEKGGTLSTARAAFAANRPVYAVPGDIFRPTSRGTHQLIAEQIAQIAYTPAQLTEELRLQTQRLPLPPSPQETPLPEDSLQARILAALAGGMRHIDELAVELNQPMAELSRELLLMEVEGWVLQRPGGFVMRAPPPDAKA